MNMKQKKDIDQVFEDGLNNLEASPSPRVWNNIQNELNKEKPSRKVIPLWVRLGGVAALLALLFTIGNSVFDTSTFDSPAITNEIENNPQDKTRGIQKSNEILVVSSEKNVENLNSDALDTNYKQDSPLQNDKASSTGNNAIVSTERSVKINSATEQVNSESNTKTTESYNDNNKHQSVVATTKTPSKDFSPSSKVVENSPEGVDNVEKTTDKALFDNKVENAIVKQEESNEDAKPSLLDAIAQQESIKEKNNIDNESVEKRWKVTPNLAPVYYSSMGGGSSIDPEFADSPQSGDINMSYGVQVSYYLNDRLSLRTGLNNVDLSYSTSDIVIATGPSTMGLRGVDYGSSQFVVTAISRETLNSTAPTNGVGELNLKTTSGDARLIQNINYYEVPLELQYAVLDSRFGLSLIGGVSTLFLGNNEVSVKSNNFNSVLGAANNLSSVSFSTNVGLGLNYKLSKRFVFNVEPMFKYQLNPYTDSSVDFKPYYLGVYSGLSFKF